MTKVVIEIEVDMKAYKAAYGPGSEWWKEYRVNRVQVDPETWENVPKPDSEYEFAKPNALGELAVDIIAEGFYDWNNRGWLKIKVDGKKACRHCGKIEGHKDWCPTIAGPEASEIA